MTVDATRLMRVTGDCFRADRVVFRLAAGRDPRAADFFFVAELFLTAGRLALALVALFPRDAARLVLLDDFRRAFPPDDFDRVAMIFSS